MNKLYAIRKIKGLSIKFGINRVVKPFETTLLNLVYLSKLSAWEREHNNIKFDDFYNDNVKYEDRFKLHDYIFDSEGLNGAVDFYEFGVADGTSFKYWVNKNKHIDSRFIGFDTFTGLPEDFGIMKKNDYDTKGNAPDIDNDTRCYFIKGMFQDSLRQSLHYFKSKGRKVIHMDADLYSSTLFVLSTIYPYLNNGDIIIFDEFAVPTHEFKAFTEFTSAFSVNYEIIGAINNYLQIAIKIQGGR